MNNIKYKGYAIVFQEVPNEITLAINICGCPYKCRGCHSQYLWTNDGKELIKDFSSLLIKYKDFITCVCFMGGDWDLNNLILFKEIVDDYSLKTAIYSGSDNINILNKLKKIKFDYIKFGSYQEKYGGLNSNNTNQKMFKLENNYYIDITNSFKKGINE